MSSSVIALVKLQEAANRAYYAGSPIMENEEYDLLFGDSGGIGSDEVGEFPHMRPMWSLQKYYVGEGEPPLTGDLVKTPKFDGAAVSLLYSQGRLVRALTRGDGVKGRDVTDKLRLLTPSIINMSSTVQIVGEVVCELGVSNARNFSSGALNLKDIGEFTSRVSEGGLMFCAYGMEFFYENANIEFYDKELHCLSTMGFSTVDTMDSSLYPTDGYVYRLKDTRRYQELGFTAKHPRGAYAEKTRDTPELTKLINVIWRTGKTGKVTPVAILEPVVIDDAVISRATLNNMAYIDALGLEIGCTVKVIRAGKIIPCIVGRV